MKKLTLLVAIATLLFAACSAPSVTVNPVADSTKVAVDTVKVVKVDTAKVVKKDTLK